MFEGPSLTLRARSAVYAPGQERVVQILQTAFDIVIEQGWRALTLREIARRCGVRVGAIGHYYKCRDDLVQDLLNGILSAYEQMFDEIRYAPDLTPQTRFERFIDGILDDILTQKTTRLFPELWALAGHDPVVARMVDIIYIRSRTLVVELVADLNPALDEEERETLALFVSASLEGTTVFAGWDKPWARQMEMIKQVARRTLVETVKSVTGAELRAGLPPPGREGEPWRAPTMLSREDYLGLTVAGRTPSILARDENAPGAKAGPDDKTA